MITDTRMRKLVAFKGTFRGADGAYHIYRRMDRARCGASSIRCEVEPRCPEKLCATCEADMMKAHGRAEERGDG